MLASFFMLQYRSPDNFDIIFIITSHIGLA
jgi:hypothetical protein